MDQPRIILEIRARVLHLLLLLLPEAVEVPIVTQEQQALLADLEAAVGAVMAVVLVIHQQLRQVKAMPVG